MEANLNKTQKLLKVLIGIHIAQLNGVSRKRCNKSIAFALRRLSQGESARIRAHLKQIYKAGRRELSIDYLPLKAVA
jgi:hypothetical protein